MVAVTTRGTVGRTPHAPAPWGPPRLIGRPTPASRPQRAGQSIGGPPARVGAVTYHRRRAVAAGLAVLLVVAIEAALGMLGGGPLPVPERPNPVQAAVSGAVSSEVRPGAVYVVQPGDTFWSIARRLQPGADPRRLVDRMIAAHDGPALFVGERLPLPGL